MRNEYRDLKKENDLIFSTLAECDRDAITNILDTVNNTRGLGYEVELVRKDLITMAAQAEASGKILADITGDNECFKRELLAAMPKPKLTDYMVDGLVWMGTYGLAVSATNLVLGGAWACHFDAVWLVLCILVMMPSAWLLQRLIPTSWLAEAEKGVRFTLVGVALFAVWMVEFRILYRLTSAFLPEVGLPNIVAFAMFGLATLALWLWRNHRRNQLAEKRPWRDVMAK